jgi:hypothetical protein
MHGGRRLRAHAMFAMAMHGVVGFEEVVKPCAEAWMAACAQWWGSSGVVL